MGGGATASPSSVSPSSQGCLWLLPRSVLWAQPIPLQGAAPVVYSGYRAWGVPGAHDSP